MFTFLVKQNDNLDYKVLFLVHPINVAVGTKVMVRINGTPGKYDHNWL